MHKVATLAIVFRRAALGLLVLLLFHLGSSTARGEDYCAATLKVLGVDGRPITSTWIELEDSSGRVVRSEMIQEAEHRICDFGFGPHTLRVGTNECLPVSISNLRLVIGQPLSLTVVLNSCGYREQVRSTCLAYFRTVDDDHRPLPAVEFSPALTDQPARTDRFGRWQGLFRGDRELTFTKPGFEPKTIRIHCNEKEDVDIEVLMRKAAPAKARLQR